MSQGDTPDKKNRDVNWDLPRRWEVASESQSSGTPGSFALRHRDGAQVIGDCMSEGAQLHVILPSGENIHFRLDVSCPRETAEELACAYSIGLSYRDKVDGRMHYYICDLSEEGEMKWGEEDENAMYRSPTKAIIVAKKLEHEFGGDPKLMPFTGHRPGDHR